MSDVHSWVNMEMIGVSRGLLALGGTSFDECKQNSLLIYSRNLGSRTTACLYAADYYPYCNSVFRPRNIFIRGTRLTPPKMVSHFEVASIENDEVSEAGIVTLEGKEGCSENLIEQQSDKQDTGDQSLIVCKGAVGLNQNRLLHLEERNEQILSIRMVKLSRLNKVRSALMLFQSMVHSGLKPNAHALNSLLSCLLRKCMLNDALSIFEFMKEIEMITGHTYSIVLKAVADERGCDAALRIFEELERSNKLKKHFDAIVYNTMISVFAKMNYWSQAEKFWNLMQKNGHTGTSITYRLLVCLFVRCGQNELALDAYHEMVQNGLEPNSDVMQAIIRACTKEGKCDLAFNVFQNMLTSGLHPNLIACNAVIGLLGKAGKVKHAVEVYGVMKSLGYEPDAYTWNALLVALYRANRHSDSLLLFERIRKQKDSILNLHIYNTALICCKRLGLWDRALRLLWEMEASGLFVSSASYNLVIGACEVARKPEIALQVYGHMIHQNHTPDTFTLLSLMRGCIWGSRWEEVEEILNEFAPNGSLYNAAIQGLCLRGKTELARKLYRKMQENDLKPDGKTRALMLQNLPKHPT